MKQTEEDADKEILEMKTKYEKLLRTEREANVRMRGEGGIVKKKLQTLVRLDEIVVIVKKYVSFLYWLFSVSFSVTDNGKSRSNSK